MTLPTPDDMAHAPLWENYVVAQAVQASLGDIPVHALAVRVTIDGLNIGLSFQLSELTEADLEDMENIVSALEALVGSDVSVTLSHEIRDERAVSPSGSGRRWIFLARQPDEIDAAAVSPRVDGYPNERNQ